MHFFFSEEARRQEAAPCITHNSKFLSSKQVKWQQC